MHRKGRNRPVLLGLKRVSPHGLSPLEASPLNAYLIPIQPCTNQTGKGRGALQHFPMLYNSTGRIQHYRWRWGTRSSSFLDLFTILLKAKERKKYVKTPAPSLLFFGVTTTHLVILDKFVHTDFSRAFCYCYHSIVDEILHFSIATSN